MTASKKANKKSRINFRQSLFWDVDPKTIDPKKHARYIIERVLELGNDEEVRWLWNNYPRSLMRDVAEKSRVLRRSTQYLWQALTRIQK